MSADLHELAQQYGVQAEYEAATGERRVASPDALLGVLRVLGAPVTRMADVPDALRARQLATWARPLGPVTLAWDGAPAHVAVRVPAGHENAVVQARLALEAGGEISWTCDLGKLSAVDTADIGGQRYVAKRLALPGSLPLGYHRLRLEVDQAPLGETLVVSAPRQAYAPAAGEQGPTWGVFLPLYALRTRRDWGCGDFSDLRRMLQWVQGQGGGVVATLPLLAGFFDPPCEPSPYSPVSRLFWNELYLDVEAIPELGQAPAAQAILRSPEFAHEREALRSQPLVDYPRLMALKRRVLEALARAFFAGARDRQAAFDRFLAAQPAAEDYARFRATGERLRTPWPEWPARLRDGDLRPGDYDDATRDYHLYVQWAAETQLGELAAAARRGGPGLYLDLPLGVHAHGYDVWREREAFAVGASGGCPPDVVFPNGQDWGLPPLHPERIRTQGYRYVLAFLRRQLQYAGILRIDHMPVFHRLFWVPQDMTARDGVYVRYPAEELYALFSLESHRHRAMLVGEDLGTVPPEVPESMARHNVHRMYVIQYALQPDAEAALPAMPPDALASVNTHDMPPFAAYWHGLDVAQRQALGLLGDADPEQERAARQAMLDALVQFLRTAGRLGDGPADARTVLEACLAHLAAGGARVTLANLEDLWLETESQNIPSTGGEVANWRRKARYTLEQLAAMPEVVAALRTLDRTVRSAPAKGGLS